MKDVWETSCVDSWGLKPRMFSKIPGSKFCALDEIYCRRMETTCLVCEIHLDDLIPQPRLDASDYRLAVREWNSLTGR